MNIIIGFIIGFATMYTFVFILQCLIEDEDIHDVIKNKWKLYKNDFLKDLQKVRYGEYITINWYAKHVDDVYPCSSFSFVGYEEKDDFVVLFGSQYISHVDSSEIIVKYEPTDDPQQKQLVSIIINKSNLKNFILDVEKLKVKRITHNVDFNHMRNYMEAMDELNKEYGVKS